MATSGQLQEEADTLFQNYALLHAQAVAAGDQANADTGAQRRRRYRQIPRPGRRQDQQIATRPRPSISSS